MSEMLGNHYFQLRNFMLAEHTYERLSPNQLSDLKVIKRLIICYTQTYKLDKALKLLHILIKKDINTILHSNLKEDDCPCNDLIFKIESGEILYPSAHEAFIALGVLWLYCNHTTSINYFQMAVNENSNNELLNKVFNHIKKLFNQTKFQTNY